MYTILLLSEEAVTEHDAARIAELHPDQAVGVHVLVPADTARDGLVDALDEIALGHLRAALDDGDPPPPEHAEQDAMHAVNATIDKLSAVGIEGHGSVTGHDPVPAAVEAVRQYDVDEVVVVTPPHPVREALHRDWASRLRDEISLPLLHFVSGTDRVVS